MSVCISAIEYLTLKGGVLVIQKAVSIDCKRFFMLQSNLLYWGLFYGLCKNLSMNCLSFLFILLVPRLLWSFFWQKMLYNVLRNIYPSHLQWNFTHDETHKKIIHCQAVLPFTHQSNPASEVCLRIFFQINSLHISKNLHNSYLISMLRFVQVNFKYIKTFRLFLCTRRW